MPSRSRLRWVLLLLFAAAGTAAATAACQTDGCVGSPIDCARTMYYREVQPWLSPPAVPISEPPARSTGLDLYGTQYVAEDDYATVADLGIDTVLIDFARDAEPREWIDQLDTAHENGLAVVAWQWPPDWEWSDSEDAWIVGEQARSFVTTVENHPALFAVYGTHEAYWNECFGCGYTTRQLQDLYSQIKGIADVPIYSAFSGFHEWAERGPETAIADGVCDYCDTWYYAVLADGTYDHDELVRRLYVESATLGQLAPNSKLVWVIQAFGSERWGKSMPSEDQLQDMAATVAEAGVDGVWWYTWSFDGSVYESVLRDYPERWGALRESRSFFGPPGEG